MAGYFSVFLVVITLSAGLIWLIDHLAYAPKRRERLALAQTAAGGSLPEEVAQQVAPEPAITETAKSVFPLLAAITVFRSFIFEPFQIPSGSMMPTLLDGDFILVNKFTYGIKDPVWRSQLVEMNDPARGDIAVFKYPEDTRIDFIKRVIGLPGDTIVYRNKQLYVKPACAEGEKSQQGLTCGALNKIDMTLVNQDEFTLQGYPQARITEKLGQHEHDILVTPASMDMTGRYYPQKGTAKDEWVVPKGHYFAMGDNRDNSQDSRFWGFVPKAHLVGKAVFIWMSFEFNNGPEAILPSWIPTGIRFERLGSIQ